jgi:glycerol kinase
MGSLVAAIDQGTTSTRCLLVDPDGAVVAADQRDHRQLFPRPGWVEHDPEEIWQATEAVVAGALAAAGRTRRDLAAVGITNQRETVVLWERATGRSVGNAIVWQDTRTDELCRALAEDGGPDRFRDRTGLPIATYFSGPKLRWLLDADPGLARRAAAGELAAGTVDAWLIWNLAGGLHACDVTNASRTLLADLTHLDWDPGLCDAIGIPMALLPEVRSSSEVYGTCVGVLEGVPLAGVLGDQHAALLGQACCQPGDAKNTYGTGCFLLANTGTAPVRSQAGLLTTVGYQLGHAPAVYALEGSIAVTGALVQWLRDSLGIIPTAAAIEPLAASVDDNGDVYVVPAFSGLFAPYWRSDARGVIVGLTRHSTKAHIARAALEAVAHQTRDVLDAMRLDAGIELTTLQVDGGMVVNDLLMQIQADISGLSISRPAVIETTALGAAYAAGLAVGTWHGVDDIRAARREDRRFEPTWDGPRRDAAHARWHQAVERSFGWAG